MASGNGWRSAWRAVAMLSVLSLSSCSSCDDDSSSGGGGAGGTNTPLLWNNTASGPNGPAGANGITPLLWVDPNTPVNSGGGGVIASQDVRTYLQPDPYYDPNANPINPEGPHPLSTVTSNGQITNPEDLLASFINAYRQQVLGIGAGGFGGGFGGGGIPIGGPQVLLPMDTPTRQAARAYCKHIAVYHAGPLTEANPATGGETTATGGPTYLLGSGRPGRLMKCKISSSNRESGVVSGPGYPDASTASNFFIGAANPPDTVGTWTHLACGYWRGFSEQHYWNLICISNPALLP